MRAERQAVDLTNGGGNERFVYIRNLVCDAQVGDTRAFETLHKEMHGLLAQFAGRFARRGHHSGVPLSSASFDDYYQGALMGLHRAMERWDEAEAKRLNTGSFVSYAFRAIQQGCERFGDCNLVHVPVYAQQKVGQSIKWLDAPILPGEDSGARIDFERSESNTEEDAAQAERARLVRAVIESMVLNERARDILRGRLLDEETLEELGVRWGITRERVRQLEAKYTPFVVRRIKSSFKHRSQRLARVLAKDQPDWKEAARQVKEAPKPPPPPPPVPAIRLRDSDELVAEMVAGSREAWEETCRRHKPYILGAIKQAKDAVLRMGRRLSCNTEDVLQEILAALPRLMRGFDAGKGSRLAYLGAAVRHHVYNLSKYPSTGGAIEAGRCEFSPTFYKHWLYEQNVPTPERIVGAREQLSRVSTVAGKLTRALRPIWYARAVEGLSDAEASERFETSRKAVRNYTVRAWRAFEQASDGMDLPAREVRHGPMRPA